MINLEWLRTFRSVYRTKSLSAAAELLNISQPTVSQQINALESYLGQKLFTRKSKGVLETDEGRILNTLVSGTIEELEEVENLISQKKSTIKTIITLGISPHLYKTVLCHQMVHLGEFVHIKFSNKQTLITDVEKGQLLYAIVPDVINTFDTLCYPIEEQELILVSSNDIDIPDLKQLIAESPTKAQKELSKYKWFAHDAASSYIKLFWIHIFNKKRPNIIPNYIVPNEFEVVNQLANEGSGFTIALASIARPFIKQGALKTYPLDKVPFRTLSLIANKKKAPKDLTTQLIAKLRRK